MKKDWYNNMFNTRNTPIDQLAPGKDQVRDRSGGYVFEIDKWDRLMRFLILGSDQPTYYASARELTVENANAVAECLAEDGYRTVDTIVEVSDQGRAASNDPALFALAMASSEAFANTRTRREALDSLPKVARIGTHLFHYLEYVQGFRGWGRGLRNAVTNWYNEMHPYRLSYQVVKYRQRDGWTHADALRLAKPVPATEAHDQIYAWAVGKLEGEPTVDDTSPIVGYERVNAATNAREVAQLVEEFGLPREVVPTEYLNDPDVWEALLYAPMPIHAMVRNLGKMTSVGLLSNFSNAAQYVAGVLNARNAIKRSRLHPLSVLVALNVYSDGGGYRGSLTWNPNPQIIEALNETFYLSFDNVEPTNKKTMLALDVSGSMSYNYIGTLSNISARMASAAMSMVTARTEDQYMFMGFSRNFVPLNITPSQSLDDVLRIISGLPFNDTDCSLPMRWALQNKTPVETFVIYTDNETNYGKHPFQALREYRQKMGINAKLIVVAMTPNQFSIADPNDGGMLDVVGFDTAAPKIISDFARD